MKTLEDISRYDSSLFYTNLENTQPRFIVERYGDDLLSWLIDNPEISLTTKNSRLKNQYLIVDILELCDSRQVTKFSKNYEVSRF